MFTLILRCDFNFAQYILSSPRQIFIQTTVANYYEYLRLNQAMQFSIGVDFIVNF